MDNSNIGNSYNSAYADFGFESILERIVNGDMGILQPKPEPELKPEPETEPEPKTKPKPKTSPKPRPKPDISNPNIVRPPNSSSNSSLLRDYEASSASEINHDKEKPVCKNPETGMPDNALSISLLFILYSTAVLVHKRQ